MVAAAGAAAGAPQCAATDDVAARADNAHAAKRGGMRVKVVGKLQAAAAHAGRRGLDVGPHQRLLLGHAGQGATGRELGEPQSAGLAECGAVPDPAGGALPALLRAPPCGIL